MLIGRDAEVARLVGMLEQCGSVILVGEGGIGKTALVREALDVAGIDAHVGQCLRLLVDDADLALRQVLGGGAPIGDQQAVVEALAATVGDDVLVLEDLHWAHPHTLAVAAAAVEAGVPLVATVRAGDPGTAAALEALEGVEQIVLGPLDDSAARRLAAAAGAGPAVDEVVSATGGNPLLLEEASRHGIGAAAIGALVATQLRDLPDPVLQAAVLVAEATEPVAISELGDAAAVLLDRGLVVRTTDDGVAVSVRHDLLRRAISDGADASIRLMAHRRLADSAGSAGVRAWHLAAAGDRDAARVAALNAAAAAGAGSTEATSLELLAARQVDLARPLGAEDVDLVLRGASASADRLADLDSALALLEGAEATEPADQSRVEALLASTLATAGRLDESQAANARLATLPVQEGTAGEVASLVARARVAIAEGRYADVIPLADRAVGVADAIGEPSHTPAMIGATCRMMTGEDGWDDGLRDAASRAASRGAAQEELRIRRQLVLGLSLTGTDPDELLTTIDEACEMARDNGLRQGELELTVDRARHLQLAGRHEDGLALADEIVVGSAHPAVKAGAYEVVGTCLLALGLVDELCDRIDGVLVSLPESYNTTVTLQWHVARAHIEAGRPAVALERLTVAAATRVPQQWYADATTAAIRAWALHDLDRPIDDPTSDEPETMLGADEVAALVLEHTALQARQAGRHDVAALRFAEAAQAWDEVGSVLALGDRWGHGASLSEVGRRDEAIEALLAVETEADRRYRALIPRVHSSLRRLGVARQPPASARRGVAGLSPRESEVVELVGRGLTSRAIARRLGTSVRTVDSQVAMAMAKLGAQSRQHAAVLLEAARG